MKFHLIDKTFLANPKRYIIQSLLAIIVFTLLLYFFESLVHVAIIAALGASTFIVFAMPKTVAAEPRRLIGGHVIGIITGVVCYCAIKCSPIGNWFQSTEIIQWFPEALAVGLSIFLMTIMNFEHPPAAATALGIVIQPWDIYTIILIIGFVTALALVGFLLRKYLRNLST